MVGSPGQADESQRRPDPFSCPPRNPAPRRHIGRLSSCLPSFPRLPAQPSESFRLMWHVWHPQIRNTALVPLYPSPCSWDESVALPFILKPSWSGRCRRLPLLCLLKLLPPLFSGEDLSEPGSGHSQSAVWYQCFTFGLYMWLCCHSVLG